MHGAEVVERSRQVHAFMERCQPARRAARAPAKAGQSLAERRVQPLDVGRVQHLTAGRAPQQRQKQARTAVNQPMECPAYRPAEILFHHLGDSQLWPRYQPGAATGARLPRPKGASYRINVGAQAIADEQQGPKLAAGCYDGKQAADQLAVSGRTDDPAEPQSCRDHQRHGHPNHPRLGLEPYLISLHLDELAGLDH